MAERVRKAGDGGSCVQLEELEGTESRDEFYVSEQCNLISILYAYF